MYPSQSQMANGLMRYRSAPSSFFEALVGGNSGAGEEFPGTVTPENLVGRYFTGDSSCLTAESTGRAVMPPPVDLEEPRQLLRPPPAPSPAQVEKKSGYGGDGYCESEIVYGASSSGGGVGFPAISHLGVGIGGGGGGFKSNLTRHSSSPAGFLANLNMENGYSLAAGLGNYSSENCSNGGIGGPRRLKSQLSFSTQDSAPSLISQLSDISNMADVGENNGNSSSDDGIPVGSWDDTHPISFGNPHRKRSCDMMNGDYVIHGLSDSQYGLAKNSLDMATMEKLLHLHQDSVPCKIRAKRGCATHPRSIAERERRTRISEKLRKLQELVPNMDKQTNTADMLDLAVQYIKTLQTDLQKLSQDRANCMCSCKQESNS